MVRECPTLVKRNKAKRLKGYLLDDVSIKQVFDIMDKGGYSTQVEVIIEAIKLLHIKVLDMSKNKDRL